MFNRDDAMKLILVCANQIAKQKTRFNKLVVFDEAHEYMTEAFGQRFDARIRYMRHEGSSYIFATQDVGSVPVEIRRHLGTNFVFSLETRDNILDLTKAAPEYTGLQLQHLEPGTCYVTSSKSTGNIFRAPRLLRVRPRASQHGGKSRIFDGTADQ
jgi:DNA helicase HerA-like ATPase